MQDNRTPADLARYAEGAKKVDPMARARLDEIVKNVCLLWVQRIAIFQV